MKQVPLEHDIKIAKWRFFVEVAKQDRAIYSNVDITLCLIVSAKI